MNKISNYSYVDFLFWKFQNISVLTGRPNRNNIGCIKQTASHQIKCRSRVNKPQFTVVYQADLTRQCVITHSNSSSTTNRWVWTAHSILIKFLLTKRIYCHWQQKMVWYGPSVNSWTGEKQSRGNACNCGRRKYAFYNNLA